MRVLERSALRLSVAQRKLYHRWCRRSGSALVNGVRDDCREGSEGESVKSRFVSVSCSAPEVVRCGLSIMLGEAAGYDVLEIDIDWRMSSA